MTWDRRSQEWSSWECPTASQPPSTVPVYWQFNSSHDERFPIQHVTWNPYWVHCKFHGWQQCPACTAEMGILQMSPTEVRGSYPPCKRPRRSQEEDIQIDQTMSFVSVLSMEQISITASVFLEYHARISASSATPHAEDIAGLQVILSLMNKLVVQPHEDSSARQESGFDVPLIEIIMHPSNQFFPIPQDTA